MLSDSDILAQLDDILGNEESGDEFLDDSDDDSERSASSPISPIRQFTSVASDEQETSSNIFQIPVTQSVQFSAPAPRKTVEPLITPNFKWKFKGDFTPKKHNFDSSKSGVQKHEFGLNDDSSILEFFGFMSEFILGKVAFETNRYAENYLKNDSIAPKSRVNCWKPTNIGELYIFIATSMVMTRCKKLEINEYWSTDPLLSSPIFNKIMSRDRF